MAPKKGAKKAQVNATPSGNTSKTEDAKPEKTKQDEGAKSQETGSKRKKNVSSDDPQKAPRRSGRGGPKVQPSKQQLLNFMLSPKAEALCRPDDETEDIEKRGDIKTYSSSVFNPFEELLSAVILSRPISHRLGLRTIRTILNDPYNFTSAQNVKDAGKEKHIQAVWDARTQHKEKTAGEIGQIADVVLDMFTSENDKERSSRSCGQTPERMSRRSARC